MPIGFGLVFGTLLGPWIERLRQRNRKQGDE